MDKDFWMNSPLVNMDYRPTLLLFILTIFCVYVIAYLHRDNYDPTKLMKAYLGFAIIKSILGFVLNIPISIIIGLLLMGAILLIYRSNHYFYGK